MFVDLRMEGPKTLQMSVLVDVDGEDRIVESGGSVVFALVCVQCHARIASTHGVPVYERALAARRRAAVKQERDQETPATVPR